MNRARWDLVAVAAALVIALSAQNVGTDAIRKNLSTGYATTSNLAFYGIVSAGTFFGSGTGLTGVAGGDPSITNGLASVSVLSGATNQAYSDLYPRSNPSGYVNAVAATNIAQAAGGGNDPDTNWWALIRVDLGTRWSDFEVRISTNGLGPDNNAGGWGFDNEDHVFIWTSTNSQMNGIPDYENFTTNTWMPAVWGIASAPHDADYHRLTALFRELPYPLATWGSNTFGGNLITPRAMVVAIRDSRPWFARTNNLSAIVVRQSADGSYESVTNMWWNSELETYEEKVCPDWRETPIEWVNHDPRPRRSIIFTDGSWEPYLISTPHQQP